MKHQPILPRSEIYYITKIGSNEFQFRKVYRIQPAAPLISAEYGDYLKDSFRTTRRVSALEERRNLNGTHFKGGLVINYAESVQHYRNYR